MPTTARGIWTPSDTDAVDFTTHLATMAGTIDTAITNGLNTVGAGANAYKGTAAQRTAFTSTAVNGMLWQDTDSIKMIWRKDGAAWVPAVWRWSGTTAQMNAFAAPNGFEWFNTTDNSDYARIGGVWVGEWVTAMPAGPDAAPRAQYRKTGSYVEMRGMGTKASGTYGLFTLPSGFRPGSTLNFHDAATPGGSSQSNIQIFASGAVNHSDVNSAWVSLDLVRFWVK